MSLKIFSKQVSESVLGHGQNKTSFGVNTVGELYCIKKETQVQHRSMQSKFLPQPLEEFLFIMAAPMPLLAWLLQCFQVATLVELVQKQSNMFRIGSSSSPVSALAASKNWPRLSSFCCSQALTCLHDKPRQLTVFVYIDLFCHFLGLE